MSDTVTASNVLPVSGDLHYHTLYRPKEFIWQTAGFSATAAHIILLNQVGVVVPVPFRHNPDKFHVLCIPQPRYVECERSNPSTRPNVFPDVSPFVLSCFRHPPLNSFQKPDSDHFSDRFRGRGSSEHRPLPGGSVRQCILPQMEYRIRGCACQTHSEGTSEEG